MAPLKLLYLGFEFWPGYKSLSPQAPATGHIFQAELLEALGRHFEIRFASLVPDLEEMRTGKGAAAIAPPPLYLFEKFPVVWHRFQSLRRLKRQYKNWQGTGWQADAVLFYNLPPVDCYFIRWLGRQKPMPKRILLLADSNTLGRPLPWMKRLRYHFKPFAVVEEDMLRHVDGCISLSQATEKFFTAEKTPWVWMPGGCQPERALPAGHGPLTGPVQFGYFGRLAADPGVPILIKAFRASQAPGCLHIWGYGELAEEIREQAQLDARIQFHGEAPNADAYVKLALACDVLINPRPLKAGNENNFPSKLFAYALSGRSILTTGFAGAKEVLGADGFYLAESKLEASLIENFETLSALPRAELQKRGGLVQQRVLEEYSWTKQAVQIARFVEGLIQGGKY